MAKRTGRQLAARFTDVTVSGGATGVLSSPGSGRQGCWAVSPSRVCLEVLPTKRFREEPTMKESLKLARVTVVGDGGLLHVRLCAALPDGDVTHDLCVNVVLKREDVMQLTLDEITTEAKNRLQCF